MSTLNTTNSARPASVATIASWLATMWVGGIAVHPPELFLLFAFPFNTNPDKVLKNYGSPSLLIHSRDDSNPQNLTEQRLYGGKSLVVSDP